MNVAFLLMTVGVGWVGWTWIKDWRPRARAYATRWEKKLNLPADYDILLSVGQRIYQWCGVAWLGLALIYGVLGLLLPITFLPQLPPFVEPNPLNRLLKGIILEMFTLILFPVLLSSVVSMVGQVWVRTAVKASIVGLPHEKQAVVIPADQFVMPFWLIGLPLVTVLPVVWVWLLLWGAGGWELVVFSWWGVFSVGALIAITYILIVAARRDPLYQSGWLTWIRTPEYLRAYTLAIALLNVLTWLPPALWSWLWLVGVEMPSWQLSWTLGSVVLALSPLFYVISRKIDIIQVKMDK